MAQRPAMLENNGKAYMNVPRLDSHVASMGTDTLWEKSYLCPCRDRQSRQPNQTCPRCRGRGIAYLPPQELRIIIQSTEKGVTSTDLGLIDSGTAIGTPDRGSRVSFRDRITMKKAVTSQSYIFDVTQRRVDKGFYLVYDVKRITFATIMGRDLEEGEDYVFDKNTNIFYPKEHLIGENVSLNIDTTLRYMVSDLLKEHRYARQPHEKEETIQQKLLLKREDIFIDKEAFSLGTEEDEVGKMVDTKRPPSPDGLNGFFRGGR